MNRRFTIHLKIGILTRFSIHLIVNRDVPNPDPSNASDPNTGNVSNKYDPNPGPANTSSSTRRRRQCKFLGVDLAKELNCPGKLNLIKTLVF